MAHFSKFQNSGHLGKKAGLSDISFERKQSSLVSISVKLGLTLPRTFKYDAWLTSTYFCTTDIKLQKVLQMNISVLPA